ncbi:MAG: hypothetical protein WD512_11745 [Candidatus Paceibacterota bacterium]
MKFLKIENNKGFYLREKAEGQVNEWIEIDQIGKEDLMALMNQVIATDEFEMDVYEEENIAHKAHQIVYKNIHEKFSELLNNKTRFKDESESQYQEALEKYQKSESPSDNQ